MKKILMITPLNYPVGGITRWGQILLSHYKTIDTCDYFIDFYALDRSRLIGSYVSQFKRIFLGLKEYFIHYYNIIRLLYTKNYDIVHLASSASCSLLKDYLVLIACKLLGTKYILHFHFGRIPSIKEKNTLEWRFLKYVSKKANATIVLDEQSKQALFDSGITNVYKVPNPFIIDKRIVYKEEFIHTPNECRVLYVGHVVASKGIFDLIRACQNIPNVDLQMIGAISNTTKEKISGFTCNKNWVELTGEMPYENVLSAMQQCSVFVLPSHSEGFPNVILEAMASGCAIVSTNVGAIPEMLESDESGSYGIIVESHNVQQLQHAISYMIDHPDFAEECRTNAKRRVFSRYSIGTVWSQLELIWKRLSD